MPFVIFKNHATRSHRVCRENGGRGTNSHTESVHRHAITGRLLRTGHGARAGDAQKSDTPPEGSWSLRESKASIPASPHRGSCRWEPGAVPGGVLGGRRGHTGPQHLKRSRQAPASGLGPRSLPDPLPARRVSAFHRRQTSWPAGCLTSEAAGVPENPPGPRQPTERARIC